MNFFSVPAAFFACAPLLQDEGAAGAAAEFEKAIQVYEQALQEEGKPKDDLESMRRAIEAIARDLEVQRETLEKLLRETSRRVEGLVGPEVRERYEALKDIEAENLREAAKRLQYDGKHAEALQELLRAQAGRAHAESRRLREFLESGEVQDRMRKWSEDFRKQWNERYGEEWARDLHRQLRESVPDEAKQAIDEAMRQVHEHHGKIREDVERSVRESLERALRNWPAAPRAPHPPGVPHAPDPPGPEAAPAPPGPVLPPEAPAPRATRRRSPEATGYSAPRAHEDEEHLRRMSEELRAEIHRLRDELARLRAEVEEVRSRPRSRSGDGVR